MEYGIGVEDLYDEFIKNKKKLVKKRFEEKKN
jgi:hypothetical protein